MIKFDGKDVQVDKEIQKQEGIKRIEIVLTEKGDVRTLSLERYAFACSGDKGHTAEENLIHERTYGNHLSLEGAVEHFFDSFPEEWRGIVDDKAESLDGIEGAYEGEVMMGNGLKLKVEIFFAEDIKECDDPWICKAYKASK
ncbi:hypothetical protein [Bacillus cereus group sp. BfR-BA-01347]|uniref:hypothetical protein n=1 Tax=Bacillus cereus group sp. BfR-BA-01347 TaxID=2920310 RepID=UPI0027E2B06E|nr:hypothetical protein [Bacillus cereus group sp. BfR-BA-01347]